MNKSKNSKIVEIWWVLKAIVTCLASDIPFFPSRKKTQFLSAPFRKFLRQSSSYVSKVKKTATFALFYGKITGHHDPFAFIDDPKYDSKKINIMFA